MRRDRNGRDQRCPGDRDEEAHHSEAQGHQRRRGQETHRGTGVEYRYL